MAYVYDNELRTDGDKLMAKFNSHWQAVAALLRLSDPSFASLGGDSQEALQIEAAMKKDAA